MIHDRWIKAFGTPVGHMTFTTHLKKTVLVAALGGVAVAGASVAKAQTPTAIKQHKAWGAYSYNDAKAGKICYILSVPTVKEPTDRNHGDVFFLISQKPKGSNGLEPQFEVGYPLKANSAVTVDVDGKKFEMFTRGQNAWIRDLSNEPQLIDAMRAGRSMKVSAESSRGTPTVYTYSLSGVTAALAEVNNCKR